MARNHLHARRRNARALLHLVWWCALAGCHGAGPYGYARTYEPLMSERAYLDRAQELPYEQVKRAPYDYKKTELAWFGVVDEVAPLGDGRSRIRLSVRTLQARNLCRDEFQDSCRITVSETSTGKFVARAALSEQELHGDERIAPGSLLKIYGTPTGDYDEHGDPVLESAYHRHWPRGYYVTTAQRGAMRR